MKICVKDIKRLLAPVILFLSLSICYAILLVLACSVFRKPTQIYRGFELFFHFALASTMTWWIHYECLWLSVDKCRPTAKVCSTCKLVCFLNRPPLPRFAITVIWLEMWIRRARRVNHVTSYAYLIKDLLVALCAAIWPCLCWKKMPKTTFS